MRLIEQTDKIVVNSEEAAIKLIQDARDAANEKGYTLGASGYTYKTKKQKGEIIDECWICSIKKILGETWDE